MQKATGSKVKELKKSQCAGAWRKQRSNTANNMLEKEAGARWQCFAWAALLSSVSTVILAGEAGWISADR